MDAVMKPLPQSRHRTSPLPQKLPLYPFVVSFLSLALATADLFSVPKFCLFSNVL